MAPNTLNLYDSLNGISFLKKSYSRKFLFVAFLGTHIPLIGIIIFLSFAEHAPSAYQVMLITFLLTLLAGAVTLGVLNKLLAPIECMGNALNLYSTQRIIPELPSHYGDDAGALMRSINDSIAAIETLLQEKKDFASMLSHDLRTPFSQMIGMIQLIRMADDQEELNLYCDKIEDEGKKQLQFIEKVLDHMRADHHSNFLLFLETAQADEIAERAMLQITQMASEKGIRVEKEIDPAITITADKTQLSHALQNLLTNAVKFSPAGSKVTMKITRSDGCVVLTVEDEGLGFEMNQVDGLFEKFAEGRKGTAGEASNGFGLYSVKKTVQQHGGTIDAHSDGPNRGARFSIKLPEKAGHEEKNN